MDDRYQYDPDGTAYIDGRRDGAAAERAQIVAWLRAESGKVGLSRWRRAADAIERGEHVTPQREEQARMSDKAIEQMHELQRVFNNHHEQGAAAERAQIIALLERVKKGNLIDFNDGRIILIDRETVAALQELIERGKNAASLREEQE